MADWYLTDARASRMDEALAPALRLLRFTAFWRRLLIVLFCTGALYGAFYGFAVSLNGCSVWVSPPPRIACEWAPAWYALSALAGGAFGGSLATAPFMFVRWVLTGWAIQ